MVAQAMQVYGGYVMDRGGAPISVSFELDPTATTNSIGSVYQQAGLRVGLRQLARSPLEPTASRRVKWSRPSLTA